MGGGLICWCPEGVTPCLDADSVELDQGDSVDTVHSSPQISRCQLQTPPRTGARRLILVRFRLLIVAVNDPSSWCASLLTCACLSS